MPPPFSPQPVPSNLMGMTDRAFLEYVLAHGSGTRVDIASFTGISKPTISESANRLMTAGLITEAGEKRPRGRGRRAMMYEANAHHGHVCAIVLERRHLVVRALDFRGEIHWEKKSNADMPLAQAIIWTRDQLEAASAHLDTPRLAATISVAAPVNPSTGAIHPLTGAPLGGEDLDVVRELGFGDTDRVHVDNDVNWAARAEATDPEKESRRSFLYVYLGAGIGSALVAEGRVIRGANGAAGEIGFLRATSGKSLQSELSSLSFGSPDSSSIDINRALTILNDPEAEENLYAGELVGHAIINAATVFDPGTVILSGPLSASDPFFLRLRDVVESSSIAPLSVLRGRADDELLLTGVSRYAIHDAWSDALNSLTSPEEALPSGTR